MANKERVKSGRGGRKSSNMARKSRRRWSWLRCNVGSSASRAALEKATGNQHTKVDKKAGA